MYIVLPYSMVTPWYEPLFCYPLVHVGLSGIDTNIAFLFFCFVVSMNVVLDLSGIVFFI